MTIGFGTYCIPPSQTRKVVRDALEAGYRLIDSAQWYDNELQCGLAIRDFMGERGMGRDEVNYTSKLKTCSSYDITKASIEESVRVCGLGYIDTFLIHSPYATNEEILDSWRACEDAYDEGLLKRIGVSNFGINHLEPLMKMRIPPMVNQIDLHPFMQRPREVSFCRAHNIELQAWGPLVRGEKMDNEVLVRLSSSLGITPARLLLSWSCMNHYIPLPKSLSLTRMRENLDVIHLDADVMDELSKLECYYITDWDPIDNNTSS